MNNTNTEERARQIIEDAMKTLPKEKYYDPLNYFPDDAFEKSPLIVWISSTQTADTPQALQLSLQTKRR